MISSLAIKPQVAVIGGSGFYDFPDMTSCKSVSLKTPYCGNEVEVCIGDVKGRGVAFIARHGSQHRLPPHKINYRSNIWALKSLGVESIIALNAVGSMDAKMPPGALVLPDQVIDYTYGRDHTFADELTDELNHIDFTCPFSEKLRSILASAIEECAQVCSARAVYGCTQGPRLETAAEINRMSKDGCHIVGMTGMPEAALARELGLEYVMLCTVVNWAAGLSSEDITLDQIHQILSHSKPALRQCILRFVSQI